MPHPATRADPAIVAGLAGQVAPLLAAGDGLVVLGLCGAQGSGKSTIAAALKARCDAAGTPAAILSIDDLYRTKAERAAMAREIHPLFATRGPPGTHDVALGCDVLRRLRAGERVRLPRFEKARDDRCPEDEWPLAPAGLRLLVFEGWMVGARPQSDAALIEPVNALERDEDRAGIWRRYANAALSGYRPLFDPIDRLVLLAAPGFAVVRGWRAEQEARLRAEGRGGMADAAIDRFVAHYERLTRAILADMPAYADLVLPIDDRRRLVATAGAPPGAKR